MKLLDVLHPIVKPMAQKLAHHEELLDEDPEVYIVALLLEAKKNLRMGYTGLELAVYEKNIERARRLLKRKPIVAK